MYYYFKIVRRPGVKQQPSNSLSRLGIERTYESDIEEDIPVTSVLTSAQSRQINLVDTTPEQTVNDTKEPTLSLLEEFLRAQRTHPYCDNIWPTSPAARRNIGGVTRASGKN